MTSPANIQQWKYFLYLCRTWANENPKKAYAILAFRDSLRIIFMLWGIALILHGMNVYSSAETYLKVFILIAGTFSIMILLGEMWRTGKTFGK